MACNDCSDALHLGFILSFFLSLELALLPPVLLLPVSPLKVLLKEAISVLERLFWKLSCGSLGVRDTREGFRDIEEPEPGVCSNGVDVIGTADCRRVGVLVELTVSARRRNTGEAESAALLSASEFLRGEAGDMGSPDFSASSDSCSNWGSMKLRRLGLRSIIIERLRVNVNGVLPASSFSSSVLARFSLLPVKWLMIRDNLPRKLLVRSILGSDSTEDFSGVVVSCARRSAWYCSFNF